MEPRELKRALTQMEDLIKFSFRNNLNVHSSIGGKYGELYVAYELLPHGPLLGKHRDEARDIRNPRSADVFLRKTGKKIEVKWGMLHYQDDDYYFKTRGKTEFWGWGFGEKGSQFKKRKFDFCVLLCAEKDGAKPVHVYVVTPDEMMPHVVPRVSGEGGRKKTSYFLQVSDDPDFFQRLESQTRPIKPCELERLLRDEDKYQDRWLRLKEHGVIAVEKILS